MRLSEWRKRAPAKDSVAPKVQAIVEAALVTLGAGPDPDCWVAWGDDPTVRYLILAPSPSGLVQLNVRVNVPGDGPRASGKIVRWNRTQIGELGVEMQGGHRLISFQVESQILNGVDASADAIAQFAQVLFAAIDGRAAPLTTISGAAGLVDDCTLATRNSGARTAAVAAMTVGKASGAHPAITATTASFSIVTSTHSGGIAPRQCAGPLPLAATIVSTNSLVGGTTGNPSVHWLSCIHRNTST